jgi:peptidase inhibitor family I36
VSKIYRVLTAFALTATIGFVAAGAAQAAPDGNLYAYEDSWFSGDHCAWNYDHSDWRYVEWALPQHRGDCSWIGSSLNSDFNDEASSLFNNGYTNDVRLFRDIHYGGPSLCLRRGERWADLSLGYERFSDGSFANDQISSHYWTHC